MSSWDFLGSKGSLEDQPQAGRLWGWHWGWQRLIQALSQRGLGQCEGEHGRRETRT